MIYVDPYDLRRPPEHVLGQKGARLARLFELIRYQTIANTLEKNPIHTTELTADAADQFLRDAQTSLNPA